MGSKRSEFARRRRALGFTQESLAYHVGVEPSTVRRWELGSRSPRPAVRSVLADALQVTVLGLHGLLDGSSATNESDDPDHDTGAELPSPAEGRSTRRGDGVELELRDLHEALRGRGPDERGLQLIELSCAQLDSSYAELRTSELAPRVHGSLRRVRQYLDRPLSVEHRRRLCVVTGRLAGLQAWLHFDLANHQAADAWFRMAIEAAREGESPALTGWLCGAWSLIPYHRENHRRTRDCVNAGRDACSADDDASVRMWLEALLARAHAGLHDPRGFHRSVERALRLRPSHVMERRHGMDLHEGTLDISYYMGTSALLLREPVMAAGALAESLERLPASRRRARAVLTLTLAEAAATRRRLDEAAGLVSQALDVTDDQPIMPIVQRSRELTRQFQTAGLSSATALDARIDALVATMRHGRHLEMST